MTYCFVCPECGDRLESSFMTEPTCLGSETSTHSSRTMRRDYRTEGVGVAVVALKREREAGGPSAVRDLFLPTARDYMSPKDPDGQRGIREWAEKHEPKDDNKKPNWPEMDRRVF